MRISVIVPVYNHEKFVVECLHSICEQNWPDLELIIIDDGSTDASWNHIVRFRFPTSVRSRILRVENEGASRALNRGCQLATGQYLALCNSDDLFVPGRLHRMVSALESSGSLIGFSAVQYIDRSGRDISNEWKYARELSDKQRAIAAFPSLGFSLLLSNVAISTGNFFFHRSLLGLVGSFRPYKLVHDWDFILRCLLETEPIFKDEALYKYRLHPHNSFSSLLNTVAEVECPELMRRFLKASCGAPPKNSMCPSPFHWPTFFESFLEEHQYRGYLQEWEKIDRPQFFDNFDDTPLS